MYYCFVYPHKIFDSYMAKSKWNDDHVPQNVAIISICCQSEIKKKYLEEHKHETDEHWFKKNHSNVLNIEFLDKDCIMAIKDFLSGKVYVNGNVEEYSPFSKIIFLILQEFSLLDGNYKRFAQNIYQAKLLAHDTNQKELEIQTNNLLILLEKQIADLELYLNLLEFIWLFFQNFEKKKNISFSEQKHHM